MDMFNLFGCILTKDGKVLWDKQSDTHDKIIDKYKLNKKAHIKKFVFIQVLPINHNIFDHDLKNWLIRVDEYEIPTWYQEKKKEYEKNIYKELKKYFKKTFIINQAVDVISDGIYHVKDSIINKIEKEGTIFWLTNSIVKKISDYSEIAIMRDSIVQEMYDSSNIEYMCGHSYVCLMKNNSVIESMSDNSIVSMMEDFSIVKNMKNHSIILNMDDQSLLEDMSGLSIAFDFSKFKNAPKPKNNAVFIDMKNDIILTDLRNFTFKKRIKYSENYIEQTLPSNVLCFKCEYLEKCFFKYKDYKKFRCLRTHEEIDGEKDKKP